MKANGDFIATFDPPTVLALLTARQEAEARAEAAERENCNLADRALAAREALEEAARVAAGPDHPALRAAIERTRAALAPHPENQQSPANRV